MQKNYLTIIPDELDLEKHSICFFSLGRNYL